MCHIILMMPGIGLAVFWLLPFSQALLAYVLIVIFSALTYVIIMKAMKTSPQTGKESLMHDLVEVIEPINHIGYVRVHGELWKAESYQPLKKGEVAEIIGINGLTLKIRSHKPSTSKFQRPGKDKKFIQQRRDLSCQ